MATLTTDNYSGLAASGTTSAQPVVRKLTFHDLEIALHQGLDDFRAVPSHAIMLCLIYPVVGLILARLVLGYEVLPLLFPLAAGFALIGPFAAIGLYELSCRREQGLDLSASHAFNVLRSPSFGAMLALGALLFVLFVVWVAAAQAIYVSYFGYAAAANIPDFARKIFTTPEGLGLIVVGCGVGFLFALVALCVSVVAFPMMLDRHSSMTDAMLTSLRVVQTNPAQIAAWGLIVAALLVVGSIPAFIGLAVVVPVLGHATWHLYRRAVESTGVASHETPVPAKKPRYAADFPASLFSRSDQ
jgi:uncharacterized membrane protein